MNFETVLYLDDMRTPVTPGMRSQIPAGMSVVRSYDEFVAYFKRNPMPDLISFDHDLSTEHYPTGVQTGLEHIEYGQFDEKTGMHCAQYLVENKLPVRHWNVHSWNVVGKRNIGNLLREHYPAGEVRLEIPFVCN